MKLLIRHKRNGYIQEVEEKPPLFGNEPFGLYPSDRNKVVWEWGDKFEIIKIIDDKTTD